MGVVVESFGFCVHMSCMYFILFLSLFPFVSLSLSRSLTFLLFQLYAFLLLDVCFFCFVLSCVMFMSLFHYGTRKGTKNH